MEIRDWRLEISSAVFTFGSLFAGIGGLDLGLERAGMTCRWQVETSPFCQKVLAKHWPDVPRYGDVRDVGKNLEPVDLICGGFPCQPHSVAGKRKGAEDDRNLWPEFSRIVEELRPAWVLAENVPGIVSTYLNVVLSDLEGLNYDFPRSSTGEPIVFSLPACAFDAPHIRQRIFVVAYTNEGCGKPAQGEIRSRRHVPELRGKDVAHTQGERETATQQSGQSRRTEQGRKDVPNPNGKGLQGCRVQGPIGDRSQDVADANGEQEIGATISWEERNAWAIEPGMGVLADGFPSGLAGSGWLPEPPIGRVATGIPDRVAKLSALGNAVVPQVAEWIGQQILRVER